MALQTALPLQSASLQENALFFNFATEAFKNIFVRFKASHGCDRVR